MYELQLLNNDEFRSRFLALRGFNPYHVVGDLSGKDIKVIFGPGRIVLQTGGIFKKPAPSTEAIQCAVNRPALFVRDEKIDLSTLKSEDSWANLLLEKKSTVNAAIPAIGRIIVLNFDGPNLDHLGTGWFVTQRHIVTNRHVAHAIEGVKGSGFFRSSYKVAIDLEYEDPIRKSQCIEIAKITYMASENDPDIAVLELSAENTGIRPLKLLLDPIEVNKPIVTLGYPALTNEKGNTLMVVDAIFEHIYGVKRACPGLVYAPGTSKENLIHDCSTLVGNSGSPLLDMVTGHVIGMHFGGEYAVKNVAVSAVTIDTILCKQGIL